MTKSQLEFMPTGARPASDLPTTTAPLSAGAFFLPDAAKDLERQMFMRGRAEFGVRHNASEDLFVAFHARDEKLV
jgi:hypothetical protein